MTKAIRSLPLLFGFLVLVMSWGGAAWAAASGIRPESFTLDNGLQVVVIPDHRVPVVTQMIWYKVGAADEVPGKSGIAHYLEHLMFKGTKTIPEGEFSQIIARNGGRDNAFTSWDYTAYYQRVAKDRLDLVMGMEADRMQNLVLSQKAVDTERQVVLEERRTRVESRPSGVYREKMYATFYKKHPYGIPVIGHAKEIEKLSYEDVFEFYHQYYHPSNATLVIAGDVTAAEVRPLAEKHFGPIPAGPKVERNRTVEPPIEKIRRVVDANPRVHLPSFDMWYQVPSGRTGSHEEVAALSVLEDVLGGGATSRLYRKLVLEQKVAVGVGSSYWTNALDSTGFYISASPLPGVAVEDLEKATVKAVDDIVAEGFDEAAVARSIQNMIDQYIYAQDNQETLANAFGVVLTTGGSIDDLVNWPDQLRKVTVEDVNAVARKYLDSSKTVRGLLKPAGA